jgi:heme A synthase
MHGGNQSDWMKPTLVGTISTVSDDACLLTYRIRAPGIWVVRGIVLLAVTSILVAVGLASAGAGAAALIALAVVAGLALVFTSLLLQTDQGIREERLLLDWITAKFEDVT